MVAMTSIFIKRLITSLLRSAMRLASSCTVKDGLGHDDIADHLLSAAGGLVSPALGAAFPGAGARMASERTRSLLVALERLGDRQFAVTSPLVLSAPRRARLGLRGLALDPAAELLFRRPLALAAFAWPLVGSAGIAASAAGIRRADASALSGGSCCSAGPWLARASSGQGALGLFNAGPPFGLGRFLGPLFGEPLLFDACRCSSSSLADSSARRRTWRSASVRLRRELDARASIAWAVSAATELFLRRAWVGFDDLAHAPFGAAREGLLALDLDHDLLRAAVAEALADLSGLDRLLQGETAGPAQLQRLLLVFFARCRIAQASKPLRISPRCTDDSPPRRSAPSSEIRAAKPPGEIAT